MDLKNIYRQDWLKTIIPLKQAYCGWKWSSEDAGVEV